MISYADYKKKLTPDERAKVDELAQKLIADEKMQHKKSENALPIDENEPKS